MGREISAVSAPTVYGTVSDSRHIARHSPVYAFAVAFHTMLPS